MINTVNEQTTGRVVNIAQDVSYTINNNTAFYSQETWGTLELKPNMSKSNQLDQLHN